jgi:hypothetical protein
MYAIPILFVPALMISHVLAFYWLLRGEPAVDRSIEVAPAGLVRDS